MLAKRRKPRAHMECSQGRITKENAMKARKEALNQGIGHMDQTPTLIRTISCLEKPPCTEKQGFPEVVHLSGALPLHDVFNRDGLLQEKTDAYAFTLEECIALRDLNRGKLVHSCILENAIRSSLALENSILNMYCKCGSIPDAQNMFDNVIIEKDVFTWTTLIAGYAIHGPPEKAFELYWKIKEENVKPDSVTFLSVIKACAKLKSLNHGIRLHISIIESRVSENVLIQSSLVDMYAKCGGLECARKEFEGMPRRDFVSWNAMLSGYAQNGYWGSVLKLFPCMMEQGLKPDRITLANVLKACAGLRMYEHGKQIHGYIIEKKIDSDLFLGSALVNMYSKCGSIKDAWKVFAIMPVQTDVCFNAMILGCAQPGCAEDALKLFWEMESKHVKRSLVTYVGALKACCILGKLEKGKKIHGNFLNSGLKANLILRNALIDMFAKCGSAKDARQVFDEMPERDVISWNGLIAGYAQLGPSEEAFVLFERMVGEGFHPDKVTFLSVIKACINLGDLGYGRKIHNHVRKKRLESDIFIASALVDMYAKCGHLDEARDMFDRMEEKNEVAWNAMIAGYVQHGEVDSAFKLFGKMWDGGTKPVKVTFLTILKACANGGDLGEGKRIHNLVVMNNLETDSFIGNSIVDMYAKCGDVDSGRRIFDGLTDQSLVSWNALISGYLYLSRTAVAFDLFLQMLPTNIELNEVTFITMTKACVSPEYLDDGRHIHCHIVEQNLELILYLGNSLIDMYARCRSVADARRVFEQMPKNDVVTWNVMIAGYVSSQLNEEALRLFKRMARHRVDPDELTFPSLLKACTGLSSLAEGKRIHALAKAHGFPVTESLGNALVDMYAKCGSCEDAREAFEKLPRRGPVSWNALITGYVRCGQPEAALSLFREMMTRETAEADNITFVNVFKACASLGCLNRARAIHGLASEQALELDHYLENTLVDAYGKCGDVEAAKRVFDGMGAHDVISWNALISAHAQSGDVWDAFRCLRRMVLDGETPNHITFVTILSVCNHAGLVDEGFAHFGALNRIHGIDYTQEHCSCIVDMLCRVGLLPEASELAQRMPFQPSSIIWMALLGACRARNELLLAIHAARNVFELEPENSALYVLLSNICGMLLDLEDAGSGNEAPFDLDAVVLAKLDQLYARLEMLVSPP